MEAMCRHSQLLQQRGLKFAQGFAVISLVHLHMVYFMRSYCHLIIRASVCVSGLFVESEPHDLFTARACPCAYVPVRVFLNVC